ncbi:MAG TPA: type II toxin-antitoxin system antitoxin SocA domain-containing protein [Usitatibacter sp.]|jgi:uncharacterized phage-associated protein|nr:type II toxin-antitoxin system antitoxin SocA domain-containing protein [Usitatibacter sp.]
MATASTVARYIVGFFQEVGDPVTNLKLQKLLYYVQGWHLAVFGAPAFGDRLEAWVHGPVQPGVYGEYKHNRWNPIVGEVAKPEIEQEMAELIDEVLASYGEETGWALERRTHNEPPWLKARNGIPSDQDSNAIIEKAWMKEYFASLADAE